MFCSLASSIDSLLAATSDLITEDIWRRLLRPDASPAALKAAAQWITLALGLLTWALCVPRIGTLATVLFFAGPLVGAMIWPIVTGLYWRSANTAGALGAMLLGGGRGADMLFHHRLVRGDARSPPRCPWSGCWGLRRLTRNPVRLGRLKEDIMSFSAGFL